MRDLRVVLGDDSELIRGMLSQALSYVDGLKLIGMAENGCEAKTMTRRSSPDMLILDVSMPHKSGIEVLREIRQENKSLLIVMFTADPSVVLREACLEAGADYYLDKSQLDSLLSICQQKLLDS